jgi:ferritin-like protein
MNQLLDIIRSSRAFHYGTRGIAIRKARDIHDGPPGGKMATGVTKENPMANEGYHEPVEELSDETRDMHRAITSLMEELEAVDWYNQRVDACKDKELAAILAHNRDEEKEHAAMVLEWIRRRDPTFDKELKDYLFTDTVIAHD